MTKIKKFKTKVFIEVPYGIRADVLLITYDPKKMTEEEVKDMKTKLGRRMHKVLFEYPAAMKAYKIRVPIRPKRKNASRVL